MHIQSKENTLTTFLQAIGGLVVTLLEAWPIVIAVALMLLMSSPAKADVYQTKCAELAQLENVKVTIVPAQMKSEIRYASMRELSQEYHKAGYSVAGVTLAHTRTDWIMDTEIGLTGVEGNKSSFCYVPRVHVVLQMAPIEVSMGTELTDPCMVDFATDHELEHVRLYQEGLKQVARGLQADLMAIYSKRRTARSLAEASATLQVDEVQKVVYTFLQARVTEVQAQHSKFDQDETQHIKTLSCHKEIQKLANDIHKAMKEASL